MKDNRSCPICKSICSKLILPIELLGFDSVRFPLKIRVSECLECGFIFNDNEIDLESLNAFYTKENFYFADNSFGTGGRDAARYKTYLECLTPYVDSESIIVDVGCGKGQLVKYLLDKGFTGARGIELDKRMVEIATQQGIPVHEGTASGLSLDANFVDLLMYTHVFEHLWDLDEAIEQAKYCLKDNGLMFIEVPNAANYSQARVFNYFWISMAEHINHFSDLYLERLMIMRGFKRVATIESIVPYNDPSFGYPSLKMLFQRKVTEQVAQGTLGYDTTLRDKVHSYISNENEHMRKYKEMVNELKNSKASLFIWGIGIEFFILSTFTDLLNCNISALIDKSSDKQGMSVKGKVIVSPEHLKQATSDSVVLLTSIFNNKQMQDHLSEISFKGRVVILEQ